MLEIRQLRRKKGWNQTELAFHAHLAPSVISQVENGKRDPSASTLRKLANALEVGVGDLFPKVQAPLPNFEVSGKRRRYAEHLMQNGVSESTARGVSGLDSRPEKYWDQLAKASGLDQKSPNPTAGEDARLYNTYEGLGYVLASSWKKELKEWDEKIPDAKTPSLFDLGGFFQWSLEIAGIRGLYEAMARDAGFTQIEGFEDTLRLMKEAEKEAYAKVIRVFEPVKELAEFRKIWTANDIDTIITKAQSRA